MDEVKTGFRIANGGAQEFFGVQADLATYAKSMGNGFPIAAIGGKEEVMMTIEPGAVAHGGTYSGNVVGTAAAAATLDILEREPIIATINQHGQLLMSGLGEILAEADVPHAFSGVPSMFGLSLGDSAAPHDLRDYLKADSILYERIMYALCNRGVLPDADGREPWFLCYSHDETILSDTLSIFEDSVREAKR